MDNKKEQAIYEMFEKYTKMVRSLQKDVNQDKEKEEEIRQNIREMRQLREDIGRNIAMSSLDDLTLSQLKEQALWEIKETRAVVREYQKDEDKAHKKLSWFWFIAFILVASVFAWGQSTGVPAGGFWAVVIFLVFIFLGSGG